MMPRPSLFFSAFRTSSKGTLLAAATLALAIGTLDARPALAQAVSTPSKNAAAAAPESPYHGDVIEDIVARVNDQVISSSDYARAESELEAQAKQRNWTPVELDAQKRQLLRDLVDNQLLLSKGKQLGVTGEAETIRQLDELRKQNNLDSMEALEKAAEQQGVSFADFKASIQNRAITSQVIRDEVGRHINITGADEQQYYQDHKDQFTTPESVKLSEILVPTADPDNAAQVAEAQTKADGLEAELKGGKDFAAVAKASSGGSTAAGGGVLGDFKRGQLANVLEDATFPLKPGGYTAPIRTKQGFVILKVDDHTPAGLQPFTQVQPQVEDALGMQKMQPALRAYLTRLREEAFVQIKPGYTDSGATTNEFRPIFSVYQPPQPKKKKTGDRTRFSGRGRTTRGPVSVAKTAAPAPPAVAAPPNVPSLADVPGSNAAVAGNAPAAPAIADSATPAAGTGAPAPVQTASAVPAPAPAKTLKPGKREKVRFGQAPRETLPAAELRTQDAGASTENGNTSSTETAAAAQSGNVPANVPSNVHYANGESATEEQAAATQTKTRFSQRAIQTKAAKIEKKRLAKADQFPAPVADNQELADKSTQARPVGIAGDTSKAPPKPKPTEKTRFSDEAGRKKDTGADGNGAPGVGATTETAPDAGSQAPAGQQPAAQTQPRQEPSPQKAPGTDSPVNTQTTPTGSGDPLGPSVPNTSPGTNQAQPPQL